MKILLATMLALYLMASASAQNDAARIAIDAATQAQLRVNYCVFGGPAVDVYLNGEVAVINDRAQTNMPPLAVWGYWHLEPGTYSVAVSPGGEGSSFDGVFMQPVDVALEAGHRYTLVVMGQADETGHGAQLVDETAAYAEIGATSTDTAHITVNNVRGTAGVTFEIDGVLREENVSYGAFQAALWPADAVSALELTLRDAANGVIESDAFTGYLGIYPGMDFFDCVGGTAGRVGEDWFNQTSNLTTSLSAVEFLKGVGASDGNSVTFDAFVAAVEAAGLVETLTTGGPHLIYAPTDDAFSRLPRDQRDALMADAQAMGDLARYHISEGYFPSGSFHDPNHRDRVTLTNLLGTELVRRDNTIDWIPYQLVNTVFTGGGSRLLVIDTVLMPRKE